MDWNRGLKLTLVASTFVILALMTWGLGNSMFRQMDAVTLRRHSNQFLAWCQKMADDKRPISEVERFFGESGTQFIWQRDHDDHWTVEFLLSDDGRVSAVEVDRHPLSEFALMFRKREGG